MKDYIIRLVFGLIILVVLAYIPPAFFDYDFLEDYENINRNRAILIIVPLIGGWGCGYLYKLAVKKK